MGSARRTQTFHALENDGVAGVSSWRAIDRRGWAARRRRHVFAVLLLVRHLSELARTQRRSARIFRAPAGVTERSRFVVGGIRSARKTIAWKFPSSIHPRRTHRGRAFFGREGMTVEPRISRIGWFVPFPGASDVGTRVRASRT